MQFSESVTRWSNFIKPSPEINISTKQSSLGDSSLFITPDLGSASPPIPLYLITQYTTLSWFEISRNSACCVAPFLLTLLLPFDALDFINMKTLGGGDNCHEYILLKCNITQLKTLSKVIFVWIESLDCLFILIRQTPGLLRRGPLPRPVKTRTLAVIVDVDVFFWLVLLVKRLCYKSTRGIKMPLFEVLGSGGEKTAVVIDLGAAYTK